MSDPTLPATPNIAPIPRKILVALSEKALTVAGSALVAGGYVAPGQEAQFVSIGTGILLVGASVVWGLVKVEIQHEHEKALLAATPPKKA